MTFGFVNPTMQAQMIRILEATPIEFSRPTAETVKVTGHNEEAFDAIVDVVRQMKFPFWSCFRALDPANYDHYIIYMKNHGIAYEEEIHGDHIEKRWILTDTEERHYDWGIEEINRL